MNNNSKGAISIRNVTKIYDPDGVNVMAVDDCSLEISSGEVTKPETINWNTNCKSVVVALKLEVILYIS